MPDAVLDFLHADFAAQLLIVVFGAYAGRRLHQLKAIPQHGPDDGGFLPGGLRPGLQDEVIHHLLTDAGLAGPQLLVGLQGQIGPLKRVLGGPAHIPISVPDAVAVLHAGKVGERLGRVIGDGDAPLAVHAAVGRLGLNNLGPDVLFHFSCPPVKIFLSRSSRLSRLSGWVSASSLLHTASKT